MEMEITQHKLARNQASGARSQDQNCLVVAGSDILDRKSHEYVQTQVVQM